MKKAAGRGRDREDLKILLKLRGKRAGERSSGSK